MNELTQKKDIRKRHFAEFLILADECEKKGWSLEKFIRYMLLINDEDKLKEVLGNTASK